MPTDYDIEVSCETDYDLTTWGWACIGCQKRVGVGGYTFPTRLDCWICGYGMEVLSHKDAEPKLRNGDYYYTIRARLDLSPSRLDLITERDLHADALWASIESLAGEIQDLASQGLPRDRLDEVWEAALAMKDKSNALKTKVEQYRNHLEAWEKRERARGPL